MAEACETLEVVALEESRELIHHVWHKYLRQAISMRSIREVARPAASQVTVNNKSSANSPFTIARAVS